MNFDDEGPWELDVVGFEVLGLALGADLVDVIAYGPEGERAMVRLSCAFQLHHPDGGMDDVDPASWQSAAMLCVLWKDQIRLAQITNAAELRVEFASAFAITSTSNPEYESWEMHAPGGVMVMATPGDGPPAIWDGDPKRTVTYSHGRYFDSDGNEISEPDYLKSSRDGRRPKPDPR